MHQPEVVDIEFKAPFTAMVVGPTGSGKTVFVMKLLEALGEVCSEPPERIIYCYGAWQELFETVDVEKLNITFREGFIDIGDLPNDGKHTVMVIDDLMTELSKSKEASDLFTKHSHHKRISCIFITQKLFGGTNELRTISGNSHHIFLFKNPRDSAAVTHLAKQIFPGQKGFLQEAYMDATKLPHSHLLLNLHQNTPDLVRVVGNYLSSDPFNPPSIYKYKHSTK